MSNDYYNSNFPTVSQDDDGLCNWMQIKAGGNSDNAFGSLRVTRPLNLGGRFIYNVLGTTSASVSSSNNLAPSVVQTLIGDYVNIVDVSSPLYVNAQTTSIIAGTETLNPVVSGVGAISIVNTAGVLPVKIYVRLQFYAETDAGVGDTVNFSIYNDAAQIGTPQQKTASSNLQTVVLTVNSNVPIVGAVYAVLLNNQTNQANKMVIKNLSFIISK